MNTAMGQRKLEKIDKGGKERTRGGGRGPKTISPVLDGPTESDTSRPLDSEEIQALAIRLDDLEKLHEKKTEPDEDRQRAFIVKKTKTGPQKQLIQVAKLAPQQPVQEHLISSGLRFNTSGRLLPYSILGSVNDYAAELSEAEAAELSSGETVKKSADDIPENGTYDKKSKRPTGSPDGGTRSLGNWQYRMDERRQVMKNMSKQLKRSPTTLLMNQTDRWRERKELLDLMDATLPLLQNGKNWRLNSEFWTQQQLIGNDETGIHTTLTRTEFGLPPPYEVIGKPTTGLKETGLDLTDEHGQALYRQEWFDSEYLKARLQQLNPYMDELVPHRADLSNLEVIGTGPSKRRSQQGSRIEVRICGKPDEGIEMNDDDQRSNEDMLNNRPDVIHASMMGPALKIDTFVFQQMATIDENEELDFIYEIRVQFDSEVNESSTRTVEITNVGTTVFYYDWQQKPYTKPFDIVNSKVQRFYFDNRTSSILPDDTLKMSFVFKSKEPGIFTERWQFLTRPILCGGRPIIFTLRGIASEEDIHRETRAEIEQTLRHKEAESIVRQIVVNILDDVRTPERARSPTSFHRSEQEQFQHNNPDLYFDYEIVEQIKKLYEQLEPNYQHAPWDMCIDGLRDQILSLDEDHPQKQELLEQLNRALTQLTIQPIVPLEQTTYLVCYDIFNQFIDTFVDEMVSVHTALQIAEPSSDSYPDVDHYGNEYDSWKTTYEANKPPDSDKRMKSAMGGVHKDKKAAAAAGKLDRGKSPKKSPAQSSAGKRGAQAQLNKQGSFASATKPDMSPPALTPEQLAEQAKLTQASYSPIYDLLCQTLDRLEQALDGLSSTANDTQLYTRLASSIHNQSLNVLDILKDELTRNTTSIAVDRFL